MQASAPAYLPVFVAPARDMQYLRWFRHFLAAAVDVTGPSAPAAGTCGVQSPCQRTGALQAAGSTVASAKPGTSSIHLDGQCGVQGIGLTR